MISNNQTAFYHHVPDTLEQEKASQSNRMVINDFTPLTRLIQQRYGDSLDAIILYGSCLHTRTIKDAVVDFYVIVDDYKAAFSSRFLRTISAWLPPTVFYVEDKVSGLRAKYAVISNEDFSRGIRHWFHPYLWARFAQPTRILYARNKQCEQKLHTLLADAVLIFLKNTLPALGNATVTAEGVWVNAFTLSYGAELRTERANRPRQLSDFSLGDFTRLTMFAAPNLEDKLTPLKNGQYKCNFSAQEKRKVLRQWRLRRLQGRFLSILRLSKATFTFTDAIDYAAWKIKRHSGVSVEITPNMRRFPILWGLKVLWSLLRQGVVR